MKDLLTALFELGSAIFKQKNKKDATHVIRLTVKLLKAIDDDNIDGVNDAVSNILRTPSKTRNPKTG